MENIDYFEDLKRLWDVISKTSAPSKLWVACLVKPEVCMMLFMQTERDWPLHLYTRAKMFPYFFSDGHHDYANYVTYYLNDIKILLSEIEDVQTNIKTVCGKAFSLICTLEHHLCMGKDRKVLQAKQKQISKVF